jgi:glyoxalase family protein
MKLHGLHHVTMISADARRNVEFYADVLGLRLVKKTVNFDQPDAYHLYFGDERGTPGTLMTWFEFPDAAAGQAGAGMVHLLQIGVASQDALGFWERRLNTAGYPAERAGESLRFRDYDGLAFELVAVAHSDLISPPEHPEIPREHALLRVAGARAYARPSASESAEAMLRETLGFADEGDGYSVQGERDHFHWAYDRPPGAPGFYGAGTVHHIAWVAQDDDHAAWRARVRSAGAPVTEIIDREYFHSIYFREPHGVLFEIATLSPGFAVDEDPEHLGERLCLPPQYERLRGQLERALTPITNPRESSREQTGA